MIMTPFISYDFDVSLSIGLAVLNIFGRCAMHALCTKPSVSRSSNLLERTHKKQARSSVI